VNESHPEDPMLRRVTPMVLRGGLIIAMTLIAAGLLRWGTLSREFLAEWSAITSGGHPPPFAWRDELVSVFRFRPRGLVLLGLACLTATPLARVLLCAATFARARDRIFVVLTGIVVVLLAVAILLGRIG
jgi:uncharacterized membrane protein